MRLTRTNTKGITAWLLTVALVVAAFPVSIFADVASDAATLQSTLETFGATSGDTTINEGIVTLTKGEVTIEGSDSLTVPTGITLKIDGGTLNIKNSGDPDSYGILNNGTLDISSGTVNIENSGDTSGILNKSTSAAQSIITITGGMINVANSGGNGIYNLTDSKRSKISISGDADINIANTLGTGIMNTGEIEITGGNIDVENTAGNGIYNFAVESKAMMSGKVILKETGTLIIANTGGVGFATLRFGTCFSTFEMTGGTLTGASEGAGNVFLIEGSMFRCVTNLFDDRGTVYTKETATTVVAADSVASNDTLSEGIYAWNGTHFKKSDTTITGVSAQPTTIDSAGGTSLITVDGIGLTDGITVTAFDGGTATDITGTTTGSGTSQAATLTFPANSSTTADKEYTVKASLDSGTTWNANTATVIVSMATDGEDTGDTPPDYTLYYNTDGTLRKGSIDGDDVSSNHSGWSGDGYTLTLNGFNFATTAESALVVIGGTTIVLEGTNTITSTFTGSSDSDISCGIMAIDTGTLTVSGDGTLNTTGNNTGTGGGYGIFGGVSGTLIINGGTINAMGIGNSASGAGNSASFGVHSSTITVNGGTITATGSNSGTGNAFGIAGTSSITINDGTVTATGNNSGGGNAYGIYGGEHTTINGGMLTAEGTVQAFYSAPVIGTDGSYVAGTDSASAAVGTNIGTDYSQKYVSITVPVNGGNDGDDEDDTPPDYTLYYNTDGTLRKGSTDGDDVSSNHSGWSGDGNTLTLNGFNFATTAKIAFVVPASVTIELEGTNSITSTFADGSGSSYGMEVTGSGALTITGGGTLNVTGGDAISSSSGIYASNDLTINSGTVNATGSSTSGNAYGINVFNLIVNGGTVTTTGSSTSGDGYGASYSVNIKGGTVTAVGSTQAFTTSPVIATGGNYKAGDDGASAQSGSNIKNDFKKKYVNINFPGGTTPPTLEPATLADLTYTLTNTTYNKTQQGVTITPNAGVGAVTVKYNGSETIPTDAGVYAISVDIAEGTSYTAATGVFVGNWTIARLPLTISADNQTKEAGNADPSLTYTITEGSLISGDTLTGGLTRRTGEEAGVYAIISTLANPNYTITYNGGSLTITSPEVPVPTAPTGSISGTVTDNSSLNLPITVTIELGNKLVASTIADSGNDNSFSFGQLIDGFYNVVADNGMYKATRNVEVISANGTADGSLELGQKQSVVEVAVTGDDVPDTPDVTVGGLAQLFPTGNNTNTTTFTVEDKTIVDAGGTIEIKLVAEAKADASISVDADKIRTAAIGKTISTFIDFAVVKTVVDNVGVQKSSTPIPVLDSTITIVFLIPDEVKNEDGSVKDGLVIYRVHGGVAEAITTTPNNGEYFEISGDNIILHLKKFSTYAVGVDADTKTITASAGTGGFISPSGAVAVAAGTNQTFTITPNSGYRISSVTVDGVNAGAVSSYTFSNVTTAHTIHATFSQSSTGGNSYSPSGGGVYSMSSAKKWFNDVNQSDWFYSAVKFMHDKGLMNGTTTDTFEPQTNLTRAMFVTVLYRMEGEPETGSVSFDDVNSSEYYAKAISWGADNGIVLGFSETEFAPERIITREQMAAIMYRYAKFKGKDVSGTATGYADNDSIADYAKEAVAFCTDKGIMQGKGGNIFDPANNATRAETAAVLQRFMERL